MRYMMRRGQAGQHHVNEDGLPVEICRCHDSQLPPHDIRLHDAVVEEGAPVRDWTPEWQRWYDSLPTGEPRGPREDDLTEY